MSGDRLGNCAGSLRFRGAQRRFCMNYSRRIVTTHFFVIGLALLSCILFTRPCSVHAQASYTIWPASTVPGLVDAGPDSAVELGVKFRSDVPGNVTGIRFYKASTNTGTHIGDLSTATGTLLATATFTNETASGWQQVNFPTPVAISANTVYIASYHTSVGHYSYGANYFSGSGVDNPPLHALADGVSGYNGVFAYGSSPSFPSQGWNSTNYWVDVVFSASGPSPLSISTSSLGAATLNVSYVATLAASGGATPYTWSIVSGSLPNGLLLNSSTGAISGTPTASGTFSFTVQVADSSSPVQSATKSLSITVTSQTNYTIWPASTVPGSVDAGPDSAVELGVKFRSDVPGNVTGIRFYKASTNTGTHIGDLSTATGTLLATATFTNETASGWQQVNFPTPVAITANTVYIASYHTSVGHYSYGANYFSGSGVDNPPLHALADGVSGYNGVFAYGSSPSFPSQGWNSTNYWVDVVFSAGSVPDTTPPTISSVSPSSGSQGVSTSTNVTLTFSEAMNAATITTSTIGLRDPANNVVSAMVTYDTVSHIATLTPVGQLSYSTTYTASVAGGSGGVTDVAGNSLSPTFTWSFVTAATPPPGLIQGPGGPILIISSASNPFTQYYAEILRTEGFNAFYVLDIAQVSASALAAYDTVILGEMALTTTQVTMLSNWVNGGGNLIAMRPDKQLAPLLGLTDASATLSDAYLLVNTASGPGEGIVSQTIQFHGIADRYTPNGASTVATLYSSATVTTSNPAVTLRNVGAGQTAAFTYDLARSVVYTRQGNPAWSGKERDGITPIRSDDLFYGSASGDPQPDWIDLNKVAIPQADEQQRLLVNLIIEMNFTKKPLPRFWYFPRGLPAVVIMSSDDHDGAGTAGRFDSYISKSTPGCSVANWECIRSSSNLYIGSVTSAQAATYNGLGFEITCHINTNCADWTPSSLRSFYTDQLSAFRAYYPGIPSQETNRTHCIVWSDYDTQPQVELANGIRLDTSYYYYPPAWIADRPGMFTGSGMPMRFAKADGTMIDVYQAATQMTDESGQTFPFTINTLLDNATGPQGYFGAFTANMHADVVTSAGSDAIIAAAQQRGVPVVSQLQMLRWLDGRNGSAFSGITWDGSRLNFTVSVGQNANGLMVMVPIPTGMTVSSVTHSGTSVPFSTRMVKGIEYAVFDAGAGSHQLVFTSGGTSTMTIWSDTATPAVVTVADSNAVELGVKFRSDVNGYITGMRFYKSPQNTGTHAGHLWSSTGTLLASVTFSNETASGWQRVDLPAPVAIAANTTYVASYHTGVGYYSADPAYFASSAFVNPPLRALANGQDGPNGVYSYGAGAFPNQTYNSNNYWVDVVFQPQ